MTEQYMTDGQGRLVPIANVKPEDKLENDIVLSMFAKASIMSARLSDLKASCFSEVGTFMALLEEKYKVTKGGKKGNLTLTSFDGLTKIQVSIADYISFGPQLQVAKTMIDECIKDWSQGTNGNIRALVDHAFRVDKNNRVNTGAILGLRRLNITDDRWKQAMDAITDSIRIVSTKQYIRFYQRPSPEAEWQAVDLDIASVKI